MSRSRRRNLENSSSKGGRQNDITYGNGILATSAHAVVWYLCRGIRHIPFRERSSWVLAINLQVMKVKTYKLAMVAIAIAVVISIPIGLSALSDERTFKMTVMGVLLTMIAVAFAVPLTALWRQQKKQKKKKENGQKSAT